VEEAKEWGGEGRTLVSEVNEEGWTENGGDRWVGVGGGRWGDCG